MSAPANASVREELKQVMIALRASPVFSEFMKTLTRRRDAVVNQWIAGTGDSEALRGEARAYDYIIKAANPEN
ncbi:MAG: hypothetical protein ACHQ9S_18830 [Candidatus Binatia bacterium]